MNGIIEKRKQGQSENIMGEIPRTYHSTHPWIDFVFRADRLDAETWRLLGLAQAKCEQISGVPLLPSVAEKLHHVYLAKGVLATTAIEGNTLTEEDVLRLINRELELPPSKEYLGREIDNILEATNLIGNRLLKNAPCDIEPETVKEYNKLVLKGLEVAPEVMLGEYRPYDVWVANYKGAPPEDIPNLVDKLCDQLNRWNVPEQQELAFGILKAIFTHIYIAWIHPFGDGNGRTARLLEFQILLAAGIPTPAAHLLSNHYNQTRSEYYRYLHISSKPNQGGIYAFIDYALRGFVDNLDEQIHLIEKQQLTVHWESYVHSCFRNKDTSTDLRRKRLVLDLTAKKEFVPLAELRHVSARIAEAYAGKTQKTVQRDVNELAKMGLVVKTPKGYRANSGIIRAFLPQKRTNAKSTVK